MTRGLTRYYPRDPPPNLIRNVAKKTLKKGFPATNRYSGGRAKNCCSRPSPQEPREVCPKGCKQGMPYFPLHFEVDEGYGRTLYIQHCPNSRSGGTRPQKNFAFSIRPTIRTASAPRAHGVRCAPLGGYFLVCSLLVGRCYVVCTSC